MVTLMSRNTVHFLAHYLLENEQYFETSMLPLHSSYKDAIFRQNFTNTRWHQERCSKSSNPVSRISIGSKYRKWRRNIRRETSNRFIRKLVIKSVYTFPLQLWMNLNFIIKNIQTKILQWPQPHGTKYSGCKNIYTSTMLSCLTGRAGSVATTSIWSASLPTTHSTQQFLVVTVKELPKDKVVT